MRYFKKAGFTLIELMIVIAVIAILSTIALYGLGQAQKGARDVQRKAIMNNLRAALECSYGLNGSYPLTAAWSFAALQANLGSSCFAVATINDPGSKASIPAGGVVANYATYSYVGVATTYTLSLYPEAGGAVINWTSPN